MSGNVTIVGAGPVGLWTAIQIKQQNPNIAVKIYEKYSVYQRKHGLHIDTANLQSDHSSPQLEQWIKSLQSGSKKTTKVVFISTKDLEDKLLEFASSAGVEVVYEPINTRDQLENLADECDLLIGADGSHSFVRETAFSDTEVMKKDLKFCIELKFELNCLHEDTPLLFDKLRELYPTQKVLNFLAEEHIGERNSRNKKQSTLRFFVDEQTYKNLGEVSFKHPKNLKKDWEELPSKLKEDILSWFAIKQLCHKTLLIVPEECAVTKLTISAYRSAQVFKMEKSRNYILVGDAAGGVPYFRALNIALQTSKVLVNHTVNFFRKNRGTEELVQYDDYYTRTIKGKMLNAQLKTATLNQVENFVKISNRVPWQVNKWTRHDMKKIRAMSGHMQEYIRGETTHQDYDMACGCGHHQPIPPSLLTTATAWARPRSGGGIKN